MTIEQTVARRPVRAFRRASSGTREAEEFIPYAANDAAALERALGRAVTGEVRFTDGDRALYATDASNYRQVPIGVVIPRDVQDVISTMALCCKFGAPFLSRGGGTSLAGQCCNTAVVVDYTKYLNHILVLDPDRRVAWVEPGVVLDDLRDAAERHHLTFGPDPATHNHNTLGGMIGNNSCGVHSVMAGRTADNVVSLDVLTYDGLRLTVGPTDEAEFRAIIAEGGRRGEIYRRLDALRRRYADLIRDRYPRIPRRVSGYNLDELLPERGFNVARALVGSEGTCVAILKAGLQLVHSPPVRIVVIIGFPDIYTAGEAVPLVLEHHPVGLEGMDERLVDFMRLKHEHGAALKSLPTGCGWLLAEFGGDTEEEAVAKAQGLMRVIERNHKVAEARLIRDKATQARIWEVRKAGLGATAFVPHHPDAWEGWEDSAVPPARVGAYLRELDALFKKYRYESALYGHFGDGCIHCRINFGLRTESGVATWRSFLGEAADLVVAHGGSISGEHGDGQSKAELLGKMYGPELLQAFREFKAIWDPDGRMNPGKVVDPYPITSNLRVGPEYRPPKLETRFRFLTEGGGFDRAALRCVGIGECRRRDESVMCPSYMATREEKHSTRGRAHLLFEMLHGGPLKDGWKSDAVEDALSLCLACKGCKHDCPVNVDMATYKAEFRSHYYAGRLRPRAAYSMGLIQLWSRVASRVPILANLLTQTPGLSALAKWAGGLAQARRMPPFAAETFRDWFARHVSLNPEGREVLLFPDTFNNFFRPGTAIAAVQVLEAAGCRVTIPPRVLCCARPLYDWGMLERADALLRQLLDTLGPALARDVPVVGLEPACVSAFRDEALALFPDDERAQRLKQQSFLFSEFIDKEYSELARPGVFAGRKALLQTHCHDHALLKPEAEQRLLERMGVEVEAMPRGCCGMAGSFGFEAEKYPISMTIAERNILPSLRRAPPTTLVLADGFSCREQIEQSSDRHTRHMAELMAEAIGHAPPSFRGAARRQELAVAAGVVGVGLLAGALLARRVAKSPRC